MLSSQRDTQARHIAELPQTNAVPKIHTQIHHEKDGISAFELIDPPSLDPNTALKVHPSPQAQQTSVTRQSEELKAQELVKHFEYPLQKIQWLSQLLKKEQDFF